ncbi:hypothetical protein [Actinomadura alba]|uniref:Uncharacterized protein n=1 Tax=Actinomadura alba TaxID=406431 RepID=A0ABR7LJ73_9ACTN|nr:hypothetical protein [Actinomadura alba]MBC6464639.1 hypothetical protein [Actinomadura alba]
MDDVVRPGHRRSNETAGPYDPQDRPQDRRGGAVETPAPEETSRTAAPPRSDHRTTPPAAGQHLTDRAITAKETLVTPPTYRLSVQEHQALALAQRLRHQIGNWIARRGIITADVGVSPYVDLADQPSVVIRMNASAAQALLHHLGEPQHTS